ncbi:MAG: TldD/PmbA family protein [Theionarchaea archaeon]|nr:TldD/PmbA family protein [Theionarchaea archaeon]
MDMPDVLEKTVAFCETKGAEGEVYGVERQEIIVTVERNDIKLCIKQKSAGIGVRTVVNRSVGFSCCNTLDFSTVTGAVETAVKMSRRGSPLPWSPFAVPGRFPKIDGLYDTEIHSFSEEDAIAAAERMIRAAEEDPRVTVDSGEFNAALRTQAVCTSQRISALEKKSAISWYMIGIAREGGDVGSFEYVYGCTPHIKEIYAEDSGCELARQAAANLFPQKVEPFHGDIILGPDAVSTLVCDPLIFSLNANNVHRGQSVLAGKKGDVLASDIVTVKDDATVKGDFSSSVFDREGSPHQAVTLAERGVLTTFLYDALAAHRENTVSTGNAIGTFRETPKIGITNFLISPGTQNLEALVEETKNGLLVPRFSGTADHISGDFSGAVKGAQLISSGEIKNPVKEVAIAGNVFNILGKITNISKERMRFPKMVLPYMRVEDMTITA